MALDPRIALAARVPDIGATFTNILTNIGAIDTLRENRETAPLRMQALLDAQGNRGLQSDLLTQQIESQQQQNVSERNISRATSLANFANFIKQDVEAGNFETVITATQRRISDLDFRASQGENVDSREAKEFLNILQTNPDKALPLVNQAISIGQQLQRGTTGNIQSSQFIPGKGFATLTRGGDVGFAPVPGLGETSKQESVREQTQRVELEQTKSELQGKIAAVKAAVSKGSKVFDSIAPIGVAIANFDDAIKAIDDGADTGVISSMLPSFRESSILLDAIQNRLGLDVIGSTTFGALSESELAFALRTALPTNLQPSALREWLVAKKRAQQKVKERLEEAASFLSDGTHTIKDWIEFDKAKQLNIQNTNQQQLNQQTIIVDF